LLAVNGNAYQPTVSPTWVGNRGMLKLCVTVSANNQQVFRMVPDCGIEMVNLKVWFGTTLLESKGAELAPPVVKLAKQYPDRWRHDFSPSGQARQHDRP